ncbi:putative Transcriptional regulator, AraC family [Vibrio nigripulchritudo MADA3029]|uniref:helix-turn-helix domain-containing protein n=1 Tax=Vibrio nigripulchritudo TaxID=28173 RepID=UPI0003B1A654|nr:helix-turn-helix domain-containing protein [Vibrio nigripulchritudo]CCN47567.1 putative Transcriptional regulator, AraC family [Vibrio nigripulchritudo MADA3020]CCN56608.1 putative Transcriptional regulator, AraC family [Vibrio nigripulchritudo MADA3021]CCN58766.1 putative Transcriptional regulator, AraC family [Vibrio nigripulchritudo MADA3029]
MASSNYHPIQGNVHIQDGYQTLVPPEPVSQIVQSFWQLNVPFGRYVYHSIPDNCVDWITRVDNPQESVFIPPFLSVNPFQLEGPVSYFGVRFQLLGYQALTAHPLESWASEVQGLSVLDLLPSDYSGAVQRFLVENPDFYSRCGAITQWLTRVASPSVIDARLANFLNFSRATAGSMALSDVHCQELGISSRQLRRVVRHHLGVSPREFQQVMRFQHAIKQLENTPEENAWADFYYDQSHFIRDCQRFMGMTYLQFRNMSVLYNSEESD